MSLVTASVSTASARGAMAGTRDMVICTGHGMVTLTLRADGTPVHPRETCPDCTLTLIAPLPSLGTPRPPLRLLRALTWAAPVPPAVTSHILPATARDPPKSA